MTLGATDSGPGPAEVPRPLAKGRRPARLGGPTPPTGFRLTNGVIERYATAIAGATPMHLAADLIGVSRNTVGEWLRVGARNEHRKLRTLPQRERQCVKLVQAVRKAQGEAGTRVHGTIAQAAGLTRQRPTSRLTRTVYKGATIDGEGRVVGGEATSIVVEERELPPDWRAAKAIGAYRFPDEMGGGLPELDDDGTEGVTDGQIMARIREIQADRERQASRAEAPPIEAESTDVTGYTTE